MIDLNSSLTASQLLEAKIANAEKAKNFTLTNASSLEQGGGTAAGTALKNTAGFQKMKTALATDENIQPAAAEGYKFQAWPHCCAKCQALDGTNVAGPMEASQISHPNCYCQVVRASDYKPFGSPGPAGGLASMTTAAQKNAI